MNGVPLHVSHPLLPSILVAAMLLALAGCQRAENRLTEATIERAVQGRATAERDGDQAALRTADGLSMRAGDSLPLPADFPGDVYLPADYAVNSVMDLHGVSMVNLSAPGDVSSLFKAAREGMRAQGWTQTLAAQHSLDAAMLAFEKPADGARRSATLSFNRHNGGGEVIVGVQLRQPHAQ